MRSVFYNAIASFKSRYHAFAVHLLFSLLIAGAILLLAKVVWYPTELMVASGAYKIFIIVILVDACFGPLLTLVAYSPDKRFRDLSIDFAFIVVLQLCALIYGSYTLVAGRPVYYVFAVDRFELVQANNIPAKFLLDAEIDDYRELPIWDVQWVYAELPTDVEERNNILFKQIEYGVDLAQTPKYYKPLEEGDKAIRDSIRSLEDLQKVNARAEFTSQIEKLKLSKRGEFGYLPLAAKKKDLTIIIHKSSLDIAGIVDLNPWFSNE